MKKNTISTPRNTANLKNFAVNTGQTFTKPSETIQGEAIGIRELMTRQQAGIPMRGHLVSSATFNDEGTGTDLRKLDFQELFEMKQDLKAKLAKKRQLDQQAQKDLEKAKLLQEVEEFHLQKASKELPKDA